MKRPQAAPPVYRPPAPPPRLPPPPVYRPQNVVARKAMAPPTAPPAYRPPPPVYRPQPLAPRPPAAAVQRMKRRVSESTSQQSGPPAKDARTVQPPFGEGLPLPNDIAVRVLDFLPASDIGRFALTHTGAIPPARLLLNRIGTDWMASQQDDFLAGIHKRFFSNFTETPFGQIKGRARPGDMHIVRAPRMRDDLQLALLARLAHVLFGFAKKGVSSEQEVQCMQLGNKLIVTANDVKSVNWLYKRFVKNSTDTLAQILGSFSGKHIDDQVIRKRAAALEDLDRLGELAKLAVDTITQLAGIKGCAAMLKTPGPLIIFLQPAEGACHAEQNFLLILAINGLLSVAPVIAGKKRPCASCHCTLALFQRFWLGNTVFIPRGGHYFETANSGLQMLISIGIKQNRFTLEQVNQWLDETIAAQQSHTSKSRSTKGPSSDKGTSEYGSETDEPTSSSSDDESD